MSLHLNSVRSKGYLNACFLLDKQKIKHAYILLFWKHATPPPHLYFMQMAAHSSVLLNQQGIALFFANSCFFLLLFAANIIKDA